MANPPDYGWFVIAIGAPFAALALIARNSATLSWRELSWFWLCGASTAYIAGLIEGAVTPNSMAISASHHPFGLAFGIVAPIEEISKYAIIQYEIRARHLDRARVLAAIGLAIGAGFASFENWIYLMDAGRDTGTVAVGRLLTATPFHLANGALGGLLAWQAARSNIPGATLGALVVIVLLHGAYDAPLFAGGGESAKYAFVLGLTVAMAIGMFRRAE